MTDTHDEERIKSAVRQAYGGIARRFTGDDAAPPAQGADESDVRVPRIEIAARGGVRPHQQSEEIPESIEEAIHPGTRQKRSSEMRPAALRVSSIVGTRAKRT